ncbi:MAG: hypothetical protein MRJ65_14025 [Candidatus Brocadiaceae bacterium]|nr:hypothetical protein [Candidatus Brocadiaceae bacterium]
MSSSSLGISPSSAIQPTKTVISSLSSAYPACRLSEVKHCRSIPVVSWNSSAEAMWTASMVVRTDKCRKISSVLFNTSSAT